MYSALAEQNLILYGFDKTSHGITQHCGASVTHRILSHECNLSRNGGLLRNAPNFGIIWKYSFLSIIHNYNPQTPKIWLFGIRDRSQTLVRGTWCKKGGPWKFLTLVRRALKKNTTDFPLKIEFTCFSMGLTRNFHGKKGGALKFFFRSEGGPRKIFAINIFCIRPPLTSVCEWSLRWLHICKYWQAATNPVSDCPRQ